MQPQISGEITVVLGSLFASSQFKTLYKGINSTLIFA